MNHKVQDLIDEKVVGTKNCNDSCDEDTSLDKDHVYEPMSSDGLLKTPTSSNMHELPKN